MTPSYHHRIIVASSHHHTIICAPAAAMFARRKLITFSHSTPTISTSPPRPKKKETPFVAPSQIWKSDHLSSFTPCRSELREALKQAKEELAALRDEFSKKSDQWRITALKRHAESNKLEQETPTPDPLIPLLPLMPPSPQPSLPSPTLSSAKRCIETN